MPLQGTAAILSDIAPSAARVGGQRSAEPFMATAALRSAALFKRPF